MKKTLIATAMVAALGVTTAQADVYKFTGEGVFTMITPAGGVLFNPDCSGAAACAVDAFGIRSQLSGLTMEFDTATGAGAGTIDPFLFSGTTAIAQGITMQAIGDGNGNPGTLIMGSITFLYGANPPIPVYLIADGAGIFGAIGGGLSVGDVVTGGAVTASDAHVVAAGFGAYTPAVGAVPFAMTTLDVNQDVNGVLVGGGFPLSDDAISGVKMATLPFADHGANFDIQSLTVTEIIPAIPVPAAVWLFGSGLLGLVGVARRKASV